MSKSSPVGLPVQAGPRKPQWKIGKEIGSGACASVHALISPEGKDSGWVVKVVPIPTKTTKKKQTPPERNSRLLYIEEQNYMNQFPEYRGYTLPNIPPGNGPPTSGEVSGYKYLTIEKMKSPFWDMIPALLKVNSNTIDLSPIALRLLDCVEVLQEEQHVLVDVKPDNFMLAYEDHNRRNKKAAKKTKVSQSSEVAADLAAKIRVLDLGMVAPWKGPQGHRPNEGISEIVGTPLYCSLHVHNLETPSRRDDLEATFYILAELVIRLVAAANGETSKYEGNKKSDIATYLPWSQGKSDEAIGKAKEKAVKDIKSSFYKRMGDKETADMFKSLFEMTQNMKYKEKPDFTEIQSILSNLQVTVEPKKRAATTRASPRRTTSRSKRSASDEKNPTPKKQQKRGATEDEEESVDAAMDVDPIEIADSDDEVFETAKECHKEEEDDDDEYEDAKEEAQDMDWEPFSKENRAKPRSGDARGVAIAVEKGPHKGEHFELCEGETESVVVGQNPRSAKPVAGQALWPLKEDKGVAEEHMMLELKASRQLCSVKISGNSEDDIWVGSKKVSGSTRCFINDTITIGDSVFRIMELPKSKEGKSATAHKKKAATKSPLKTKPKQKSATSTKAAKAPAGADVVLKIVSGPHKGQSYSLAESGVDTLTIGSKKSAAKKGDVVVLESDEGIDAQHVRFSLVLTKKLVKVAIVDLSKSGTSVNGKPIKKNKEHMAWIGDRCAMGETVVEIKKGD